MEYIFVICSKESNIENIKSYKFINTLKNRIDCIIYFNGDNTKGLSENYNKIITSYIKHEEDFTCIFMHDDVVIEDLYFFEKLEEGLKQYDIVGLAGTRQWKLTSPAVWNNCPREAMTGAVAHSKDDKLWMTAFGVFGRALLLDGLFLAVKSSTLKKSNLLFDPQFTFHFYDLDFCLEAYKKQLKCGTIPIWVTHYSMGDWTKDQTWAETEKKFLEKWK